MGTSADPEKLPENKLKAFQGTTLLGMGFTFEDTATSDLATPGTPSPLKRMEEIIEANPRCSSLIKKYIGGEELNSRPIQDHRRHCIDFGDRDLDSCATAFPDLLEIVTLKVKPERLASAARSNSSHANRCRIYWQHYHRAKELYSSISCLDSVVAVPMVGGALAFAIISADQVFANTLIVFSLSPKPSFALPQSRVHETWARVFASSMKDDFRYSTSDCFEAYPLPRLRSLHNTEVEINSAHPAKLSIIGELYHQFRAELMVRNNEGLTSTYNRFHDPAETSDGLLQLRALHQEMDEGVLEAYGWSDALTQAITDNPHHTPCGFGLDYLDTEEDAQLPEELQERIDTGDLFFWDAGEALDFQGQLRASGAVKAKKRLPWRYRWPDAVRDDVLARLLALNAERYAEEVAMGLHSKGGRAAARGGSSLQIGLL